MSGARNALRSDSNTGQASPDGASVASASAESSWSSVSGPAADPFAVSSSAGPTASIFAASSASSASSAAGASSAGAVVLADAGTTSSVVGSTPSAGVDVVGTSSTLTVPPAASIF